MPRGIPYFFESVVMGVPGEWEKEGGKRSGGLNLDTSFQVVSRKHRISPAPPARYISTIALLHHQQQKNGPQPVFSYFYNHGIIIHLHIAIYQIQLALMIVLISIRIDHTPSTCVINFKRFFNSRFSRPCHNALFTEVL
ncbi:Uncharacterised protein [Staphylococcus piscifermentans]|nr:Uncharacterised protein [Staphylococcus piscifermentans]